MDIDRLARDFLKNIKTYKPGKPIEVVQRERNTTSAFIKLASNENPNPIHPRVRDAVIAMLAQANRYPESSCYHLVRALAEHVGVGNDEIFVGNGSNEIIDLLVRAFVDPGEKVVFPTPSFVIYGMVCRISGVEGIAVPCRDFKLDLPAMSEAVDAATKIVFLCNPNNPTGTYFSKDEMDEFLASIPDALLVVMDEAYFEYVRAADYPDSIALRRERNTIVTLRTFSKMYSLAGLRVGYAVADPKVVQALHKVRQPFNVNRLAQAAAAAALECADEIKAGVEQTIAEREAVRRKVLDLGCKCPPSETNFLYVVPPPFEDDICERLLDHGVIVRDMTPFGGEANSFRVTIGTPDENRQFVDALSKLLNSGSDR
jgi:histidinol-phosphate aminotransferase